MSEITPEQKLDEIYRIIKNQEKRRKADFWYHIFKWLIIAGFVFFVATNSAWILGKITDMILPIVTENMKTMMKDQKNGIMDQVKDMLPDNMKNRAQ